MQAIQVYDGKPIGDIIKCICSSYGWYPSTETRVFGRNSSNLMWLRKWTAEAFLGYVTCSDKGVLSFEDLNKNLVDVDTFAFTNIPSYPPEVEHLQVDSGLGYTCDEEILPFVLLTNNDTLRTQSSCQEWWQNEYRAHKRRFIMIRSCGNDAMDILKFCIHMKESLNNLCGDRFSDKGWIPYKCELDIDFWTQPDGPSVSLWWDKIIDSDIIISLQSFSNKEARNA